MNFFLYYEIIIVFRIVKLTSPNLNYLIVVGVVFLSLSMIGYSYPFSSELALRIACPVRILIIYYTPYYLSLCFAFIIQYSFGLFS